MCRGSSGNCSEFGPVESWSRHAPLPPPGWVRNEILSFAEAARCAAGGDVMTARSILAALRSDEAREFFVEHAQIAAHTRRRVLQIPRPPVASTARKGTIARATRERVYERDRYHCRYCGLLTVPQSVIDALRSVVGDDVLPWGRTNASRHGIALLAHTECDHVHPATLGGSNQEENLVTACPSCNYGKDGWTLAELGLEDPRSRPPVQSAWDGLTSLLPRLVPHADAFHRVASERGTAAAATNGFSATPTTSGAPAGAAPRTHTYSTAGHPTLPSMDPSHRWITPGISPRDAQRKEKENLTSLRRKITYLVRRPHERLQWQPVENWTTGQILDYMRERGIAEERLQRDFYGKC